MEGLASGWSAQLHVFPVNAQSKSLLTCLPSQSRVRRVRCLPGPSSQRFPAGTFLCWMPPAVMVSLVSGSAIPCINCFLSGHVFPPHAHFACRLLKASVRVSWLEFDCATSVPPSTHRFRENIRQGWVSSGNVTLLNTSVLSPAAFYQRRWNR